MPKRATSTSYKPGQSGNPTGRPPGPPKVHGVSKHALSEAVRARYGDGSALVEFWGDVMVNKERSATGETVPGRFKSADSLKASELLAEWGYSKPKPALEEGEAGEKLEILVNVLAEPKEGA